MRKIKDSPSRHGIYNRRASKREREAGRPQSNECEVCFREGTVFDHCHKCGKFRGWLCNRDNLILGMVKDDPRMLMALASYLADHECKDN